MMIWMMAMMMIRLMLMRMRMKMTMMITFFFYICYNPRGGVRTVFIWTISHHIVPSHGSYDPSRIEYDR